MMLHFIDAGVASSQLDPGALLKALCLEGDLRLQLGEASLALQLFEQAKKVSDEDVRVIAGVAVGGCMAVEWKSSKCSYDYHKQAAIAKQGQSSEAAALLEPLTGGSR